MESVMGPVMMTEPMAAVPAMAPCIAWQHVDEKECNCQEGDRDYVSHFYYLTTLRHKRSPQAMRRQRFDLTANVCVGDSRKSPTRTRRGGSGVRSG